MIEQTAILGDGPEAHLSNGAEQRIDPRFTLLIRPAKIICDSGEFVCVVRDISSSGVSVRTFHPLPASGDLHIELQHGNIYRAACVWNRDREAGLEFCDKVDVRAMVSAVGRFPKRQLRMEVGIPVQLAMSSAIHEPGLVMNLSQQGARVETHQRLSVDQRIRILARDLGEISAVVRWRRGNAYGVIFDTTFTLEQFAILLAKIQSPSLISGAQ